MHDPEQLARPPEQLFLWEDEGDAVNASSGAPRCAANGDTSLLERLGTALVREWNHLPMPVQRTLYEAAAQADADSSRQPTRRDLARFLHDHKRGRRHG